MPISIQCPECTKKLHIKEELRGRRVKCPACGHPFRIPISTDARKNLQEAPADPFSTQEDDPHPHQQHMGNGLIIAGYVCSALAIVVAPVALAALVIGIVNLRKGRSGHGIIQVVLGSGVIAATAIVVILLLPSARQRDAAEIRRMSELILSAELEAINNREFAKSSWLHKCAALLIIEQVIVDEGGQIPDEAKTLRTKINLAAYNETLQKYLTPKDFTRLAELRRQYGYTKYVEPAPNEEFQSPEPPTGWDPSDLHRGSWEAELVLLMGARDEDARRWVTRVVFQRDKAVWYFATDGGEGTYTGVCRIDTSKQPNEIDLAIREKGAPEKTVKGIFFYEGERLTLCWGAERPSRFSEVVPVRIIFKRR